MKFNVAKALNIFGNDVGNYLIKDSMNQNNSDRETNRQLKVQDAHIQDLKDVEKMKLDEKDKDRQQNQDNTLSYLYGEAMHDALMKNPTEAQYRLGTGKAPSQKEFDNGLQEGGDYPTALENTYSAFKDVEAQAKEKSIPFNAKIAFTGLLAKHGADQKQAQKMSDELDLFHQKAEIEAQKQIDVHRANTDSTYSAEANINKVKLNQKNANDRYRIDNGLEADPTNKGQKQDPGDVELEKKLAEEEAGARALLATGKDSKGNPVDLDSKIKTGGWPSWLSWAPGATPPQYSGTKRDQIQQQADSLKAARMSAGKGWNRDVAPSGQPPAAVSSAPEHETAPAVQPGKQAGGMPDGARTLNGGKYWTQDNGETIYDAQTGQRVK